MVIKNWLSRIFVGLALALGLAPMAVSPVFGTDLISPLPKLRFVDSQGNGLSGGELFTYAAGSTTKQTTWTDSTGGTPNTNPVILDSRGEASVWLDPALFYKFTLSPSTDTDPPTAPIWTVDQVGGAVVGATLAGTGAGQGALAINYKSVGTGAVVRTVYAVLQQFVSVKDFGAVGNDSNDDTAAFTLAAANCAASSLPLYIPAGTYHVTGVATSCNIYGDGPMMSVIKNYGTGIGLNLTTAGYYQTFQNFGVDGSGNVASGDGIEISAPSGGMHYSYFNNVYSRNNGGHGLYQRGGWGNRFAQCKFDFNGGLGVFLDQQAGDLGGANAATFEQTDIRWNGGSATATTYADNKGGLKVVGGYSVHFSHGVIESNNAWGVILSNQHTVTPLVFSVTNSYMEGNPSGATVGGNFFVSDAIRNVRIANNYLSYGGQASGKTGYNFWINRTSFTGAVVEYENEMPALGVAGATDHLYYGDNDATGVANTITSFSSGAHLGVNVLRNSTFVNWYSATSPLGWTSYVGGGGTPTQETDTPFGVGGNLYSMSVQDDAGGSGRGMQTAINVRTGMRYRISGYVKSPTTNVYADVNIASSGGTIIKSLAQLGPTAWTPFVFDYTATEPIQYLQVNATNVVGDAVAHKVYFSGLSVQEMPGIGAYYLPLDDNAPQRDTLSGSASWTPGAVANGASASTTVTVTGASVGDFVVASYPMLVTGAAQSGFQISASVTASNTVTATLSNNSGGSITLDPGTVYVRVIEK